MNEEQMTEVDIFAERLARIGPLASGAHQPDGVACVMEAVAFVAGEPWSDHPECTSLVISRFLRSWNDALPDDERDALLRPLILRLIETRGSVGLEERRALMAADWLVRVNTPAWLRLAGLNAQAEALVSLPEITSLACVPLIRGPIEAARHDADAARDAAMDAAMDAARDAAGDAARNAARDAAWNAARDAARDAAGDAARNAAWNAAGEAAGEAAVDATREAAGDAAGDATWNAAMDAAWNAAWNAAREAAWNAAREAAWNAAREATWNAAMDALSVTRLELQKSALALVERMIDAREVS